MKIIISYKDSFIIKQKDIIYNNKPYKYIEGIYKYRLNYPIDKIFYIVSNLYNNMIIKSNYKFDKSYSIKYFENKLLHRIDGPAVLWYDEKEDKISDRHYWNNGTYYNFNDDDTYIRYIKLKGFL